MHEQLPRARPFSKPEWTIDSLGQCGMSDRRAPAPALSPEDTGKILVK
jgi:hypothetical protein